MKIKKIKPIIKWTGGKYEEYTKFSNYIPSFDRYIEPFFGGGGVFFALQPNTCSFVNDKSTDLINFYRAINSSQLKVHLFKYVDAWESIGRLSKEITPLLCTVLTGYITNKITINQVEAAISNTIENVVTGRFKPLFEDDFIVDKVSFTKKLKASLIDKFKRIKDISVNRNRVFTADELADHIETGLKSGLYLFLRHLMNQDTLKKISLGSHKAIANWYFVRELCYASMFRFNAKREFNIPYGGIAYNKKNLRSKINNILSAEVETLLSKTEFSNLDFEEFFKKVKPAISDFIFLDPPYDSEFSEYDQNEFSRQDQVRLRDSVIDLEAKWMLIIKETPFIRELYNHPNCNIIEFDKTYTYNVRGRNNRDTKHLIIVNYAL